MFPSTFPYAEHLIIVSSSLLLIACSNFTTGQVRDRSESQLASATTHKTHHICIIFCLFLLLVLFCCRHQPEIPETPDFQLQPNRATHRRPRQKSQQPTKKAGLTSNQHHHHQQQQALCLPRAGCYQLLLVILVVVVKRLDKGHGNARVTVDVEVDRVKGADVALRDGDVDGGGSGRGGAGGEGGGGDGFGGGGGLQGWKGGCFSLFSLLFFFSFSFLGGDWFLSGSRGCSLQAGTPRRMYMVVTLARRRGAVASLRSRFSARPAPAPAPAPAAVYPS